MGVKDRKTVLVTGSSKGIGLEIASRFAQSNYNVILNGRNEVALKKASDSIPGTFYRTADVSDPLEAKSLIDFIVENFGSIDIVVCNVGDGRSVLPGRENNIEWNKSFAANLWSVTNVVEASVDELEKSAGCIVCISSICGMEHIQGAPVTYSVAKAALNAYIKASSGHLGIKGIRINGVAPGNILFEGSVWERKLAENPENVKNMLQNSVPLSRLGNVTDISEVVFFLASDQATFVTGSVWKCDGGQTTSF